MKYITKQIVALTKANMSARYRKTIAGFLWVVLNPIIMYSVQSFVFRKFLKIDVPDYSLFLLSGLLPWIFFTMTLEMVTPVLDNSAELLKSFKLNPVVLILSQVLDNFINFLFAFLVVLVPFWIFGDRSSWSIFLLPIVLLILVVGVTSICGLLSFLQVFYKDIRFITSFVVSILFFLTPIFYPIEFVPQEYRVFIELNPIYLFIEPLRTVIYDFELNRFLIGIAKGVSASVLIALTTYMIWKKKYNEFYTSL